MEDFKLGCFLSNLFCLPMVIANVAWVSWKARVSLAKQIQNSTEINMI